jgi:hypothetical protein
VGTHIFRPVLGLAYGTVLHGVDIITSARRTINGTYVHRTDNI